MRSSLVSIFSYCLLAGICWLGLVGCSPNPLNDLSAEDSKVFITNYDDTVNFSNYRTFSIPDSVEVIYNDRYGLSADNFDLAFLSRIRATMQDRGYTEVERVDTPELGINVMYVQQVQTGVTVNPYYYGSGYWGYGGGYYYPSYYSYYQVSDSYWYIELLDLKNAARNGNKVKVIWAAQVRGDGLGTNPNGMIDAIFAQSPYLKKE
ncbi:DUF4136 domain-containing protein [Xanthocytophaga agilis]|uniref:DUF4136 domain-containing protein n=1 Tax=Xanthocytophaga agilis TaxID=3048010 RepID=A0AAE3UH02_9BACT|nr:DUF4136 domain-containing protein [Xanthocytophaga agilis]MDJ1503836.1 DUF4136 domain-containing protein [Xanthocytophaga agilis]